MIYRISYLTPFFALIIQPNDGQIRKEIAAAGLLPLTLDRHMKLSVVPHPW